MHRFLPFLRPRYVAGLVGVLMLTSIIACRDSTPRSTVNVAKEWSPVINQAPQIRVAMDLNIPQAVIKAGSAPALIVSNDGKKIGRLQPNQSLKISSLSSNIKLGRFGSRYNNNVSFVSTDSAVSLYYNDVAVAPMLRVIKRKKKTGIGIVAHLDLEEYLVGVLGGEVPDYWPAEALKAQAVAARTYALHRMKIHQSKPYDVRSDVRSQVFRPSRRANVAFRKAVESTRAQTLVSLSGKLFPAYFHSTCGNYTAEPKKMFPHDDIPTDAPLHSTYCGWCNASPVHRWDTKLKKADITNRIKAYFGKKRVITKINRLEFLDGAGTPPRYAKIRIHMKNGSFTMPAQNFRLAIGSMKLKSTMITSVETAGDSFQFTGGGFGHGVGMCQFGACGAAKNGMNHREILRRYYPGTRFYKPYR